MCRDPMRKHGRTASGSQRWRCTACNLTTTAPRAVPPARTEQATLGEFIAWATSKGTQADQPGGARAFRRRTAWCWRVPVECSVFLGPWFLVVSGCVFAASQLVFDLVGGAVAER